MGIGLRSDQKVPFIELLMIQKTSSSRPFSAPDIGCVFLLQAWHA
jgi:hypothetical protein